MKKLTRRKFIATSALTGAGALIKPLTMSALPNFHFEKPANFTIKILATNWGFEGSWDAFCEKAKKAGYDGVEVWVPGEEDMPKFLEAAAKYGLAHSFLGGGWESDATKHLGQFEEMLRRAVETKPLYFNCHSGKDWYSFEQGRRFMELGFQVTKSTGVPVYHETHRGRILFAAHVAQQYLEALPDLRLTLDISHWCNVHESLLDDQPAAVALALSRTGHIHARVGHAEGPQVNDPRAPEWSDAVNAHFAWWDQVVKRRAGEGGTLTFLTEFGPPSYLPTVPYTQMPLANQWDINVHMMKLLRERYG